MGSSRRRRGVLAALRYGYDQRGRIRIEPKEEAKARLGRSPDLADVVSLAFTGDAQSGISVYVFGWGDEWACERYIVPKPSV